MDPGEEKQAIIARMDRIKEKIQRAKLQKEQGNQQRRFSPYSRRSLESQGALRARVDRFGGPGPSFVATNGHHHRPSRTAYISKDFTNSQPVNNSNANSPSAIQTRPRATEEMERRTRAVKDTLERGKLLYHVNHVANGGGLGATNNGRPTNSPHQQHHVVINGIRFLVAKNGSKLVRDRGDNSSIPTPKIATVAGVKFYRSKSGNLYRMGIVQAQQREGAVKKKDLPCMTFSTTGSCSKGPQCSYQHDPSKVAACRAFLLGTCPNSEAQCDLAHRIDEYRTPDCLHYNRGSCSREPCQFSHRRWLPGASVCYDFGLYGYCKKGDACSHRHVFECPYFSNTGVCKLIKCKLPHVEKASTLRNKQARDEAEMEDLSSDDESRDRTIDSSDVDSDAVDEFIGPDDDPDIEMAEQRDYIAL